MICKIRNCTNKISSKNTTGFCQDHRGYTQNQCEVDGCDNYLTSSSHSPCVEHRPVCQFEECNKYLQSNNNIGYCRTHRHYSSDFKKRIRENYLKDRDNRIQKAVQWRFNNYNRALELSRSKEHTRRTRKRNSFIEKIDHRVVWERDQGICYLCGLSCEENNWDLDHIVPLARGGTHEYSNVAVTHSSCNRRKHTKFVEELEWGVLS